MLYATSNMKKILFVLACVIVPQVSLGAVIYTHPSTGYVALTANYHPTPVGNYSPNTYDVMPVGFNLDLAGANANSAWAIFPKRTDLSPLTSTDCRNFSLGVYYSGGGTGYGQGYPSYDYLVLNTAGNGCVTNAGYGFAPANSFYNNAGKFFIVETFQNYAGYELNGAYVVCTLRSDCLGVAPPPPLADGIVAITAPTGIATTTPTHLTGTYNNGISHVYPYISFVLENTTYGLPMKPIALDVSTAGAGNNLTYDLSTRLPAEGNYSYAIFMFDMVSGSTTPTVYGSFSFATTTATINALAPPSLICEVWNIACYFKQAMIWLVYPSESLVISYNGFLTTIQSKPPIGYFTLLASQLTTLNASSTPIVNFIIPPSFQTYIFHPFDLAISTILWFFFAIHFYKRLKTITI